MDLAVMTDVLCLRGEDDQVGREVVELVEVLVVDDFARGERPLEDRFGDDTVLVSAVDLTVPVPGVPFVQRGLDPLSAQEAAAPLLGGAGIRPDGAVYRAAMGKKHKKHKSYKHPYEGGWGRGS